MRRSQSQYRQWQRSLAPSRVRCPGCGKKYNAAILQWVLATNETMKPVCKRCINKLLAAQSPTLFSRAA